MGKRAGRRAVATSKPASRPAAILARLRKQFPAGRMALHHWSAFELLMATILSAQCTDERVNQVTPILFSRYPDPHALAKAGQEEIEEIIRSTGFFRMKARSLKGCSEALVREHNGEVPASMESLVLLPGVGRKTANVVLGQFFGKAEGVVVDTHVHRVSKRLGWTTSETAAGAEQDLMTLFRRKDWIDISTVLILHGRTTCKARRPVCSSCVLSDVCPSAGLSSVSADKVV